MITTGDGESCLHTTGELWGPPSNELKPAQGSTVGCTALPSALRRCPSLSSHFPPPPPLGLPFVLCCPFDAALPWGGLCSFLFTLFILPGNTFWLMSSDIQKSMGAKPLQTPQACAQDLPAWWMRIQCVAQQWGVLRDCGMNKQRVNVIWCCENPCKI